MRDNGIGMTRDEVVDLIGTIAKSGTAELRQQLRRPRMQRLGGADRPVRRRLLLELHGRRQGELVTRQAGEAEGTRWESSGEGTYTIESVDDAPQGTAVTLHLKPEDAEDELYDYTAEWKIREIVKRYSDFITWPIRMEVERRTAAPRKAAKTRTIELETLNSMKALWARPQARSPTRSTTSSTGTSATTGPTRWRPSG